MLQRSRLICHFISSSVTVTSVPASAIALIVLLMWQWRAHLQVVKLWRRDRWKRQFNAALMRIRGIFSGHLRDIWSVFHLGCWCLLSQLRFHFDHKSHIPDPGDPPAPAYWPAGPMSLLQTWEGRHLNPSCKLVFHWSFVNVSVPIPSTHVVTHSAGLCSPSAVQPEPGPWPQTPSAFPAALGSPGGSEPDRSSDVLPARRVAPQHPARALPPRCCHEQAPLPAPAQGWFHYSNEHDKEQNTCTQRV